MKGKIWKQLLSVFCVMLLLMTSSGVVALADDMQGEIVVTEDSLETESEGEYSDALKQDMQENFEDVSLASIPEDEGISVPLSQEDDNALMADESDSMEIEEDILAEEEIEESLVGALESSGNSTIDSFINDSRFTAGVYWPGDKTPVLSPFTSWGCCAYCADYTKYCYGINNPRGGSVYYNVNEIRQGDVLTVGNQSNGYGHWFICLKREGNSLYVAEANYLNRVRIGWNYSISGSRIAGTDYSFTSGYHFLDPPPPDPDIWGEEMTNGYEAVLPDGDYAIVNAADQSWYLDIMGGDSPAANGTNVNIWGPADDLASWDVWNITYSNGFYTIRQKDTDICLDVTGGDRRSGTSSDSMTGVR